MAHHLEIEDQETKAAQAERDLRAMLDDAWIDLTQPLDDFSEDMIDQPAHYAGQGRIECIEVLEQLAADGHDFRILNAMKYLWRYRHKGQDESLRKAVWYIQRVLGEGQF